MERNLKNFMPFFVFIVAFFIFSANIGGLSIYSLDEAKNSECAREMLERGDFIVPTFNYELRTDKPPVHYYFMMLSYKLFGVSEFSARFFSSVFGALTVLITFLIARKYLGDKTAFFSFVVLVSSIHLSLQFHMAVPDPYLIFFVNAALFSFYTGVRERKKNWIYLFYLFMGLGVLTKGPVAVVLPSVIVFTYMIFTKNLTRENLKFLHIFRGIFIVFAVSLPWYVAVYIKTDGKWIYDFILKHNIHRFSAPMEGHGGIFLITFIYVFVGMLPFSVFVFQALKRVWKERNDFLLFLLIFASIYTGFFAVSKTKLPNYTVPVYPALGIIFGYYLTRIRLSSTKGLYSSLIFYVAFTILLVIGLFYGIKNEPEISDLSYLSFWFIILTAGGFLALYFLKKKNFLLMTLSLSIFSIFMGFVFFYIAFPPIDRRNPVMQMLPLIDKKKEIRYYRNFNPAFVFYIRKHIKPLGKDQIERFLDKSDRVFILTRKRYTEDILVYKNAYILKTVKDLFERKISVLVSNRP